MEPREMIPNHFETERFDLLKDDRVCVADYRFGHNCHGKRDVWIERSVNGERFLSQITFEGEALAVRKENLHRALLHSAREDKRTLLLSRSERLRLLAAQRHLLGRRDLLWRRVGENTRLVDESCQLTVSRQTKLAWAPRSRIVSELWLRKV